MFFFDTERVIVAFGPKFFPAIFGIPLLRDYFCAAMMTTKHTKRIKKHS